MFHPSTLLWVRRSNKAIVLVTEKTLKEFIMENLNTGFIQPTSSLHSVPVLFIKKKDGSLCLCVDFCGLNHISKKDHYPLPLISDLLDSPHKAQVSFLSFNI